MRTFDTEYFRQAKEHQRNKVIAHLGGRCTVCGSTSKLEIDHIDPNKKTFNINRKLSLKNPKVLAELENCQLLCNEHHTYKTLAEREEAAHGSYRRWAKHHCKCEICDAAHRTHNQKRRLARMMERKTSLTQNEGP